MSLTSSDHREAAGMIAGMIPRFDRARLADYLARADYRPRYNVGPGQDHWVVRARAGRPILARARWGMPGRGRELVINARAETVRERPMFRGAFDHGRCLVVADGFFEWDRRVDPPQPWWFRDAAERGLLFAAVLGEAFAIVTVAANPEVAVLHARMPAIVEPTLHERWLFGTTDEAYPLLTSAPPGVLRALAVSRRINAIDHDDPACVAPVELAPVRQLALLDPG